MGKKELGSAIEYRKLCVGEEIKDVHSVVECVERLRRSEVNEEAMVQLTYHDISNYSIFPRPRIFQP
jgi:hypothetical protein